MIMTSSDSSDDPRGGNGRIAEDERFEMLFRQMTELGLGLDAIRREIKLIPPRIDTLVAEVSILQERLHRNNNLMVPLVDELNQLREDRRLHERSLELLEARVRLLSDEVASMSQKEKTP